MIPISERSAATKTAIKAAAVAGRSVDFYQYRASGEPLNAINLLQHMRNICFRFILLLRELLLFCYIHLDQFAVRVSLVFVKIMILGSVAMPTSDARLAGDVMSRWRRRLARWRVVN